MNIIITIFFEFDQFEKYEDFKIKTRYLFKFYLKIKFKNIFLKRTVKGVI
jgi:hypothetical protein